VTTGTTGRKVPVSRALVLGGGGVTGIAWEIGLLKGLRDLGVDLAAADTVIGTSAGSVVGAQVTTALALDDLYAAQLREPRGELAARFDLTMTLRYVASYLWPGDEAAKRRRLGRMAVAATTEPPAARVAVIRSRLPVDRWPERRLRVTAVDAESGELQVFDRGSGVDIVDAVAASCAVPLVWPPVPIDGRLYVDGGIRSATNADLAAGADRVVVVAPLTRSPSRRHSIGAQLGRTGASRTFATWPDPAARRAIGRNVLDPARRADAARAGLAQASTLAEEARKVWVG
jgi:NTE family protein